MNTLFRKIVVIFCDICNLFFLCHCLRLTLKRLDGPALAGPEIFFCRQEIFNSKLHCGNLAEDGSFNLKEHSPKANTKKIENSQF